MTFFTRLESHQRTGPPLLAGSVSSRLTALRALVTTSVVDSIPPGRGHHDSAPRRLRTRSVTSQRPNCWPWWGIGSTPRPDAPAPATPFSPLGLASRLEIQ